jgi:hypothetical protein
LIIEQKKKNILKIAAFKAHTHSHTSAATTTTTTKETNAATKVTDIEKQRQKQQQQSDDDVREQENGKPKFVQEKLRSGRYGTPRRGPLSTIATFIPLRARAVARNTPNVPPQTTASNTSSSSCSWLLFFFLAAIIIIPAALLLSAPPHGPGHRITTSGLDPDTATKEKTESAIKDSISS